MLKRWNRMETGWKRDEISLGCVTGHTVLVQGQCIGQEHGNRHRTYSPWYWSDVPRHLFRAVEIHVPHQTVPSFTAAVRYAS